MVVRQPLWEQNDTTDQSADIVRLLLRDLTNDRHGIIQDTAFEVRQRGAGANNSVDVQPGGILIPGTQSGIQGYYYVVNDAVVNVPMSTAAHGSLPRIDTVYVRVRDSFYAGVDNDAGLIYLAGTASSTPVPPTITDPNTYRLADISVPANDNTIITSDITDKRLVAPQGHACVTGGIITCTSSTRPSSPRRGQVIFETNTRQVVVNEGTALSPNWVVYAVPGSGAWINYTPTITGLTGASNTRWGRYFRMGSLVIAVAGFLIGTGGDVTSNITITLPSSYPCSTLGGSNITYVAVGRGYDASANTYWSATGGVTPSFSTTLAHSWGTAGTAAWGGGGTIPFNWAVSDAMHALFAYETPV